MATYGQLGASVGAAVLLLWPFLCVFGPPSLLQHYLLPPAVVIGALLLDAASFRITNRHILTFGAASLCALLDTSLSCRDSAASGGSFAVRDPDHDFRCSGDASGELRVGSVLSLPVRTPGR